MHTSPKAPAALALLALGWIGAATTPAFAEGDAVHGAADKAAAYQAEGLGTTTDGFGPSTDLVPTVTTDADLGGTDLVTQTDAGLASLTGLGGGQGAAAAETPAVAAPAPAPRPADPVGQAERAPRMLRGAEATLRAGRFVTAEHRLERAETAVLNARRDGDTGYARSVDDLVQAREAAERHDRRGAEEVIARAFQDVANRADRPAGRTPAPPGPGCGPLRPAPPLAAPSSSRADAATQERCDAKRSAKAS
jgi:hypothetical protein